MSVYSGGTCKQPTGFKYREFVLVTQDDIAHVNWGQGTPVLCKPGQPASAGGPDDRQAQVAINYKAEPMAYRLDNVICPVRYNNEAAFSNAQGIVGAPRMGDA